MADDINKTKNNSFANLMSSTKRMHSDKVAPFRKKIPAVANQRRLDDQQVMDELLADDDESSSFFSGDELTFLRDGYPKNILRKLRRGEYAIQEELDLHGMIVDEAKQQVHAFINECARFNISAVRIVHGKGLHSKDKKPVIKNFILGWMKKNQFVIAVCSTPANDGGTGAVYALLKNI